MGKSGRLGPGWGQGPGWSTRVSVCLVYRKFCSLERGLLYSEYRRRGLWTEVERRLEDGTGCFRGKLSQFPVGKGKW